MWHVWLANARASVVREMEFRGNFMLGIIRQMLWFVVFVVFVETLFARTEAISGWSRADMFVILALSRIIEGTMGILFINNWMNFTQAVNKGTFDFYLLKPVPAQFYTGFRALSLDNLGNVVAGIGLLFYALPQLTVRPSAGDVLMVMFLVPLGMVVYYSLIAIVATLVFRLERLDALWGFNQLLSEPLTVPLDVFPSGVRVVLTYLLPIALVVFVPAQAFTGRLVWWQVLVVIATTALFLFLANLAWRAGLRRYSSASS